MRSGPICPDCLLEPEQKKGRWYCSCQSGSILPIYINSNAIEVIQSLQRQRNKLFRIAKGALTWLTCDYQTVSINDKEVSREHSDKCYKCSALVELKKVMSN